MHSFALLISGALEIFGIFLNSRFPKFRGYRKYIVFSVIMANFGLSLLFLRFAMNAMPMSVAYAIWTAIGAIGAVGIGIVFDNEKFNFKKAFYLALIVFSVIMLKIL